MTDREKLLALLVQGCREERGEDDIPCCEESFCKDNHTSCYGETADYLLAHGVVVQRWIPVTESQPDGECLAVGSQKEMLLGYIYADAYSDTLYSAENDGEVLHNITHWMPLPEPPKED